MNEVRHLADVGKSLLLLLSSGCRSGKGRCSADVITIPWPYRRGGQYILETLQDCRSRHVKDRKTLVPFEIFITDGLALIFVGYSSLYLSPAWSYRSGTSIIYL